MDKGFAGDKRVFGSLDLFFESGPVIGRKVANVGFLHALLSLDPFDEYHFFLHDPNGVQWLQRHIHRHHPEKVEKGRVRFFLRRVLPHQLQSTGYYCFHQSDCASAPYLAALRNRWSTTLFPVTSLVHSLSYSDYLQHFLPHMWPGATPRDVIVSTSRAGEKVLEAYFNVLRERFGLDTAMFPVPPVRRIPLGVDTDALRPPTPEQRENARQRLGLERETVAILILGRLSPRSKMDLFPVLRAFQRLIRRGVPCGNVRLLPAGWAMEGDETYVRTLESAARNMGLGLTVVERPSEAEKIGLLHAADVFLSPADNAQETFGLTLLEAGATGLPAVVSDFDGYRDIVEHGRTGLLVPTFGLDDTGGVDSLAPLLPHDAYHLLLAQNTVADVEGLAEALALVIADAGERRRMGEAARRRVEALFSWKIVVQQYVRLWAELWNIELDAEPVRCRDNHPLTIPYAKAFAWHVSAPLPDDALLVWTEAGQALYRGKEHPVVYEELDMLVQTELLGRMVFMARKPVPAGRLVERVAELLGDSGKERAAFMVRWALKHDFLGIAPENPA